MRLLRPSKISTYGENKESRSFAVGTLVLMISGKAVSIPLVVVSDMYGGFLNGVMFTLNPGSRRLPWSPIVLEYIQKPAVFKAKMHVFMPCAAVPGSYCRHYASQAKGRPDQRLLDGIWRCLPLVRWRR